MRIAVASPVNATRGTHGILDRHAIAFDFLPNISRKKNVMRNANIPTQTEPMCIRQLGTRGSLPVSESQTALDMTSAEVSPAAPPKHATASAC